MSRRSDYNFATFVRFLPWIGINISFCIAVTLRGYRRLCRPSARYRHTLAEFLVLNWINGAVRTRGEAATLSMSDKLLSARLALLPQNFWSSVHQP